MTWLSRRSGLWGLLASLLAPSAFAVPLPRSASPKPEPPPGPDALHDLLQSTAVLYDSPIPRVLYTWTTQEQVEGLHQDRVLLVRTESPVYGQTAFARTLASWAEGKDPVALALAEPRFARHRYAWTQAWATARGCAGEVYGDRLLRVELRASARMAIFDPAGRQPWRFVDSDGHPLTAQQFLAEPERMGVVHHLARSLPAEQGTFPQQILAQRPPMWDTYTPGSSLSFREYVLLNEGMVHAFEVDTEAVRAELARSLQTVRGLQGLPFPLGPAEQVNRLYRANIALECPEYEPAGLPAVADQLQVALDALRPTAALRHQYGALPR